MWLVWKGLEAYVDVPEGHFLTQLDDNKIDLELVVSDTTDLTNFFAYLSGSGDYELIDVVIQLELLTLLEEHKHVIDWLENYDDKTEYWLNKRITSMIIERYGVYKTLSFVIDGMFNIVCDELDLNYWKINNSFLEKCEGHVNVEKIDIEFNPLVTKAFFTDTVQNISLNDGKPVPTSQLALYRKLDTLRCYNNPCYRIPESLMYNMVEMDISTERPYFPIEPRVQEALLFAVNLRKLNINDRVDIQRFPNNLEELYARGTNITDQSLTNTTKLRILDARDGPIITTVEPFADTLKELRINGNAMTNEGLSMARFIEVLYIGDNVNVNTIDSFVENLSTLKLTDMSALGDFSIRHARNLKVLTIYGSNITTVEPFANTLEELIISMGCNDKSLALSLSKLTRLRKAYLYCMSDVNLSACRDTLEELDMMGAYLVNGCLTGSKSLKRLYMYESYIGPLNVFAESLEELSLRHDVPQSDADICMLRNLKSLDIYDAPGITTLAPFADTLEELTVVGTGNGLSDNSLVGLKKLKHLTLDDTDDITSIAPLASTLKRVDIIGNAFKIIENRDIDNRRALDNCSVYIENKHMKRMYIPDGVW